MICYTILCYVVLRFYLTLFLIPYSHVVLSNIFCIMLTILCCTARYVTVQHNSLPRYLKVNKNHFFSSKWLYKTIIPQKVDCHGIYYHTINQRLTSSSNGIIVMHNNVKKNLEFYCTGNDF